MTPQSKITFKIGDAVRVRVGPFTSFTGKIEGINQTRQLLKVVVSIFRRKTALKLGFGEVEKIEFTSPVDFDGGLN